MLDEIRTEALAGLRPHPQGLQVGAAWRPCGVWIRAPETFDLKFNRSKPWCGARMSCSEVWLSAPRRSRPATFAARLIRSSANPLLGVLSSEFVHVGDRQLTLDGLDIDPAIVTDTLSEVVRASAADDATEISEIVPDEAYRNQFLRLIGTSRQMAVRSARSKCAASEQTNLRRFSRQRLEHPSVLIRTRRSGHGHPPEREIRDVLRVIDLNRRRIALGPTDREQKCVVPDDLALVDLITGLEDRNVRVRGHWQGRSFVVHNIEPDDDIDADQT